MPMPASRTRTTAEGPLSVSSRVAKRAICPPGSLNLAALSSRLQRIWESRAGSASRKIGFWGRETASWWPRLSNRSFHPAQLRGQYGGQAHDQEQGRAGRIPEALVAERHAAPDVDELFAARSI